MSEPVTARQRLKMLQFPAAAAWIAALALAVRLGMAAGPHGWPSLNVPPEDVACDLAAAESLARGRGPVLPFAWHYLDGIPDSLPTPAFEYRMPLPALIQSLAARVGHGSPLVQYLPMAVAGAILAGAAAYFGFILSGRRDIALIAGAVAAVSPVHVVASAIAPSAAWFAVFASGAVFCMSLGARDGQPAVRLMSLGGLLAGLAFMCRLDGLALPLIAAIVAIYAAVERRRHATGRHDPALPSRERALWHSLAAFLACFLIVATPWALWRARAFGAVIPNGLGRFVRASSRPDMYRVGAVASEGDWRERERIRWTRVRRNGQFLGLVVGLWLPFVLIDGWRRRKDLSNLPNYALILLIFVGRCIVLTPPSLGGGLARSTAAVFPLLCVAGVQGLDWSLAHLPRLRSLLAAAAAIIVTLHGGLEVVIGARAGGDAYRSHAASAASLVCGEESAAPARTVLSDRPATIGRLSGVPALPIPSDDLATVAEVAAQVGADVMVVGDGFIDEVPGLAVATLDRRRLVQIRMFDEGGEALFVYDITRLPNAVAIELAIEGDADRAARILRLALEHTSPESPGYMPMARNLGRILTEAGKPQEALTALATALSTRPGDAAALYWLGRALISLGRYDEALDALRRVQDLDPEFAKSRGVADSVSDLRARIRRAARDGDERP